MRARITFVHGADEAFDPEQLQVKDEVLKVRSLKAAREDRLTFSPSELPQEVNHPRTPNGCIADSETLALVGLKAVPRASYTMDIAKVLQRHCALRFSHHCRTTCFVLSSSESFGVCKRISRYLRRVTGVESGLGTCRAPCYVKLSETSCDAHHLR